MQLSEKEARFCFGMSKMTIVDEVANHDKYAVHKFVEFLEYIGRTSRLRYLEEVDMPFE